MVSLLFKPHYGAGLGVRMNKTGAPLTKVFLRYLKSQPV